MSLKAKLTDDMKAAMKSGEKERLGTIRLINAAIKQREVDERIQLDDAQILVVLEKALKQRRDSITQFEAAGRTDLADKEKAEVVVIQAYLPAQMTPAEVDAAITAAIAESSAAGPKDMGKVMG
ncbi:MAG TPA: GatB/YqeY domain-containing protein, partial [Rudaea sp.]|nr:GatB/YqeY domain-containing protein [Rudaea sp.]